VTFEKASVGLSLLYTVPQLGALALLSETVDIPEVGVDILVILSLATAVLGGGQAILQTQSRRTLGYLILSGSGVVLAGIVAGHDARAGALILWMFSGIAVSGMGLTLWVIEKRKGTLLLSPFNGLYDRMPYLAVIFVLFGLGCSGFPGTPGYVGVELLLEGLGYRYPTLSLLLFVAIALSGIAIVRAYFGIFCGKRLPEANHYRVQRHEIIGFTLLVIPLLLAGFFPSLFLN
jgi:NADH-quinone oxidoreductase subunit M